MTTPRASVLIGCPCYGGIDYRWVESMFRLGGVLSKANIASRVMFIHKAEIARARNKLASLTLESQATHLLFPDTDEAFDADDIVRWIDADLDVVAAMVARKELPINLVGHVVRPLDVHDGYLRAEMAGAGLMLIHRRTLEKMRPTVSEYVSPEGIGWNFFGEYMHRAPDGSLRLLPEDFAFCQRVRALGLSVYLDPRAKVSHFGRYEYKVPDEMYEAMR